jgi:hypothetical protein
MPLHSLPNCRFIFERQRREHTVITGVAYNNQEREWREYINQGATSTGGRECSLNHAFKLLSLDQDLVSLGTETRPLAIHRSIASRECRG